MRALKWIANRFNPRRNLALLLGSPPPGHREDVAEWLYDNRERAHMRSCRMCNPEATPLCECGLPLNTDGTWTCGWCR